MASQAGLPPPNGQVLSLVSALSNPENHDLHVQAIRARDEALSASPESYGNLCLQLSYLLLGSDQPGEMLRKMDPAQIEIWKQTDMTTALRLQQDESLWTSFGQMAGFILKTALLHPPIKDGRPQCLVPPAADHVKDTLLFCLGSRHHALRAVASSVIATSSVSVDGLQPALHIRSWPQLVPTLLANLQSNSPPVVEGTLTTVRKMMEDGPSELGQDGLDALIPLLLRFFSSPGESYKASALQAIVACLSEGLMPSALVANFSEYLAGLSALATDPSVLVRKWVCRSIVTLLELRTEHIRPHMEAICQFMLESTANIAYESVALEACEFWLTFCSLEDEVCTPEMVKVVESLLPRLVPILLRGMVYTTEQQAELLSQNEQDAQEAMNQASRPIFHRSRAKQSSGEEEDDDDDDDFGDADGNAWTLRKCSGASLDSLANLYGAGHILPPLLPALEEGLSNADPWVQEASILALGAVAEGCRDEMNPHMAQLHPYLMTQLAAPETPTNLPQLKSIAAWTIGRYASWAVDQVQSGAQGHLLAQMTEVFLTRLGDRNRRVQVACCSAFGVLVEAAGDLLVPYLPPIYEGLVSALSRYQGRSLIIVFDTLGIIADYVGPAIGEGPLPGMYIPPLMRIWDGLAAHDPTDRTLLPLMESLASIALTCETNFQPYALEAFENSMCMIEEVTLRLTTAGEAIESEEDADPIVCAVDLLDGLVEGMKGNFAVLVSSSARYGQHFPSVLHSLVKHEVAGVRMSALALLGDLARCAPTLIEPALPQLLHEAIACLNTTHPSVCNNAVWAIGEVCVRCGENPAPLEKFAPSLMQSLIALLMGNGYDSRSRGSEIPGLAENAAATVGRLAKVSPNFVAPDLPRFLLGWCDGMAKITDPTERHDAFDGFIKAVYVNPQCIQHAAVNVVDAIRAMLFAVVSWHVPAPAECPNQSSELLNGGYQFQPFPPTEAALGSALAQLLRDVKAAVGDETWASVQNQLPVNVKRLLREIYQL